MNKLDKLIGELIEKDELDDFLANPRLPSDITEELNEMYKKELAGDYIMLPGYGYIMGKVTESIMRNKLGGIL